MSKENDDKLLISLSDIMALFHRSKDKIFRWMFLLGFAGFLFALSKPVKYKAEGTFREKSSKGAGIGNSLAQMLSLDSISGSGENEAEGMIKSRKLMSDVITKLNLQAQLSDDSQSVGFFTRAKNNIKVEWNKIARSPFPTLQDTICPLTVDSVVYSGEVPVFLKIQLDDQNHYQVLDKNYQVVGESDLDLPFITEQYSFVLSKATVGPVCSKEFTLNIIPIASMAEGLTRDIYVESTKLDKGVLKISYTHPNRFVASRFVNTVMESYQDHLKQNHDQIAVVQMEYLYKKKRETADELNKIMQQHANLLSKDLSNTGFADSRREMEFLAQGQHQLKEQLLANELEIKRLKNIQPNNHAYYDQVSHKEGNPVVINTILTEIRHLKQEAQSLEIALQQSEFHKTVEEDQSTEYQGMDIQTARELYIGYCKQLNGEEASIRRTHFVLHQMENPDFEITSLSSVLTDSVSLNMITKASQLEINLRDQNNQSVREQGRLRDELALQRTFLTLHLQQMIQLMEINKKLINEKIYALQNRNLELVHQRISLLEKNLTDYVHARLDNLQQERTIIKQHLSQLRSEMSSLPKKWMSEQLIDQQVESNQMIVKEIAKIVESKNISHNLEVIQSAPIDLAIAPVHPLSPGILLYSIIGAMLGGMIGSGIVLAQSLSKGLQATESSLKALNLHVAGQLSAQDVTALRRLQAYFESAAQAKTILLLEGNGYDYSLQLAQLIQKKGQKVLTIDLNLMQGDPTRAPGLLQYLQREVTAPTIVHEAEGDYLPAGGSSPHAIDLLTSQSFKDLIEALQSRYDWILAVSPFSPATAEAESVASLFSLIAVTVQDESIEQLNFYIDLNKDPHKKVSFILDETGLT